MGVRLGLGSIASEHIWDVLAIHVSSWSHLRRLQVPVVLRPRRVLVSLPALEEMNWLDVHWPSAPPYSILALQSRRLVLVVLFMSFMYHTCVVALLEWLIHTPTSSTLVDIGLHPLWDLDSSFQQHNSFNIGRKLNDFTQVFARSIA